MLFSHPGNVDPSYPEYFTPSHEDVFFGGSYDAYSVLEDDERILLSYGNPEYYPQEEMDRFFMALAERMMKPRAARCVIVIPYDKNKENREGKGTGLDIVKQHPEIFVEEIFTLGTIASPCERGKWIGSFQFWPSTFWKDGKKAAGNAPFEVGIILIENQAARTSFPSDLTALKQLYGTLLTHAGNGGALQVGKNFENVLNDDGVRRIPIPILDEEVRKKVARRLETCIPDFADCIRDVNLAVWNGIMDKASYNEIVGQYTRICPMFTSLWYSYALEAWELRPWEMSEEAKADYVKRRKRRARTMSLDEWERADRRKMKRCDRKRAEREVEKQDGLGSRRGRPRVERGEGLAGT